MLRNEFSTISRRSFVLILLAPMLRWLGLARTRFTSLADVDLDLIFPRCFLGGPPRFCPA